MADQWRSNTDERQPTSRMSDILVYWRDYRANSAKEPGAFLPWHSSAAVMGRLQTGDRLWMVTSGRIARFEPASAGFLVEVRRVQQVIENLGEDPAYPRDRYCYRVLAARDSESPPVPLLVDDIIRPANSSMQVSIGSLLQGPRQLSAERIKALTHLLGLSDNECAIQASLAIDSVVHDVPIPATDFEVRHPLKHPDVELLALGIRQPWVELILRGIKTIEVRSLETNIRGPIYLYASKTIAKTPSALAAAQKHGIDVASLPMGQLTGTVEITDCCLCNRTDAAASCVSASELVGKKGWMLANPQRLEEPLRPRFLPYGVWFYPFRRRNESAD